MRLCFWLGGSIFVVVWLQILWLRFCVCVVESFCGGVVVFLWQCGRVFVFLCFFCVGVVLILCWCGCVLCFCGGVVVVFVVVWLYFCGLGFRVLQL